MQSFVSSAGTNYKPQTSESHKRTKKKFFCILHPKNCMMLIVADSGSTKTDWRIHTKSHGIREIQTIGLNPYFLTVEEITLVLEKGLHPFLNKKEAARVFFYGSGCSHAEQILKIETALANFFSKADVSVESDLLGAARALCGDMAGIVGILGTGSNTCVYNGQKIVKQILSLGYILGDEGSGAVLGKKVLKSVLSGKMPKELVLDFKKDYPFSEDSILGEVYSQPFPNRFLASYAPFAVKHLKDEWMKMLIHDHFTDFFDQMITIYEDYHEYTLNIAGSIAWYLQPVLEELCMEYKMSLGNVIKRPIDDLVKYHLDHDQD